MGLLHDVKGPYLIREVEDAGAGVDHWFARQSIYETGAKNGTASWEEIDKALRVDHSQHEKDYTPDIHDTHEVINWDE